MDKDDMLKLIKEMKPIPFPTYDGIKLPSFPPIRQKGVEKVMEEIRNLETRNNDVLICTFVKSGTHWTYEIVNMLLRNTTKLDEATKMETMLESVMDLSAIDSLPSPRILDTHLKFKYLPKKFIEDKGKIVHMIRNPKSVCVSSYFHAIKDKFAKFEGTFEEFFEEWIGGNGFPYGSWFDYELELEQAKKDNPGMIYTVHYEEMKMEPEKEIRKLADFLGVTCSDDLIKEIAIASSFDNMQKNKKDLLAAFTDDGKSFVYRKGQIGDWKNYLTVAQNERFDILFKEKMRSSSYNIIFE